LTLRSSRFQPFGFVARGLGELAEPLSQYLDLLEAFCLGASPCFEEGLGNASGIISI
jgi:hypothetical protein